MRISTKSDPTTSPQLALLAELSGRLDLCMAALLSAHPVEFRQEPPRHAEVLADSFVHLAESMRLLIAAYRTAITTRRDPSL